MTRDIPIVGAALAAVLLTGLGTVAVRSGSPSAPAAAQRPVPTTAPTATRAPGVRLPFGDLEGRLGAPVGYERVDDAESRLGALDAGAFAARFAATPEEAEQVRTGLVALGFQAARGHLWLSEGRVYGCVVVRLATGGGAKQLLDGSRKDTTGRFTSGTVPRALTYVEEVGGFSVQHGLFARGRFVYEVTLTTPDPEDDHAVFDELLLAQRNHAEQSDP